MSEKESRVYLLFFVCFSARVISYEKPYPCSILHIIQHDEHFKHLQKISIFLKIGCSFSYSNDLPSLGPGSRGRSKSMGRLVDERIHG